MTRQTKLAAMDPLLALEVFVQWFWSEILQLAPDHWRHYFSRGECAVLAARQSHVIADADGQQTRLQLSRVAGIQVSEGLLILSPELVYRRTIVLPLMSEWSLRRLVQFEALRFDPMPAHQSCFDYRLSGRDFASRVIQIELFYIRKTSIDAAIQHAATSGLTLCGACVGSVELSIRLPRLLRPSGYGGWLSKRQTRLLQHSAAAFAAVAIALIVLFIRIQAAEVGAQRKMEHLRLEAAAAQPERRVRQSIIDEIEAINLETRKSTAIAEIAEITHLLPDTAWLTSITKNDDGLELRGFAAKAAELVETFSRSALFHDVRFNGPIVKDGQMNIEQFDVHLRSGVEPQ